MIHLYLLALLRCYQLMVMMMDVVCSYNVLTDSGFYCLYSGHTVYRIAVPENDLMLLFPVASFDRKKLSYDRHKHWSESPLVSASVWRMS